MKTYGTLKFTSARNDEPGKWRIECEPHVMIRLKRIFLRIAKQRLTVATVHDAPDICRDLQWFMERYPLSMSESDRGRLECGADIYVQRAEQVEKILGEGYEPPAFDLELPLRDYQARATQLYLVRKALLCGDEVGLGKQQPIDSLVMTPQGYRPIGHLKVGDLVTGSDGHGHLVTGVFPQGRKQIYRVTFSDHSNIEAGPEHLWTVIYWRGGRERARIVVTTEELRTRPVIERQCEDGVAVRFDLSKTSVKLPMLSAPVEFSEQQELPIDPYMLGALIANGCLCQSVATLTVGTHDKEQILRLINDRCSHSPARSYGSTTHINIPGLLPAIRRLKLDVKSGAKFIPCRYLKATPQERIDLLHGLMDGDGSITETRNRVAYHTISPGLALDVRHLVEGLGGIASVRRYDRSHEDKPTDYQVRIRLPEWVKPFTLPRKADRYRPSFHGHPVRSILSVEPTRITEAVCISVDSPDRLYATGHCILTHNTAVGIGSFCDKRTLPAVVVTLTALPRQWQRQIAKFMPGLHTHIVKKSKAYDLPEWMGHPPDVVIMNYAKLGLGDWAQALSKYAKSVIFDECQELRRQDSDKWRACNHLAKACDFRCGLSATPVYNYGGELWNILEVLAPNFLGTRSEFEREWCNGYTVSSKAIVRDPKALGSYLRDQGVMLRRTRKEVGRELPPVTKVVHEVEADPRVLQEVKGSAIELAQIILRQTDATKERRYTAAGQFDMIMRQATGIAKAPYVAEFCRLLLESEENLLIYAWHREVYTVLMDGLRDFNPVMYTGSESPKEKEKSFAEFTEKRSRAMLMSLRSGAGLDGLQHSCRTVVYSELDWSPGVHEQATGRIARDGQTDPVMAYYLIADNEDSSDPFVMQTLGLKIDQVDGIRDPDSSAVTQPLVGSEKHIHDLAEAYMARMGKRAKAKTEKAGTLL